MNPDERPMKGNTDIAPFRHFIRTIGRIPARIADRSGRPVLYAVSLETVEAGLLLFSFGLTVETIAPGLITSRFPWIPYSAALAGSILLATYLGIGIRAPFPFFPDRRSPLVWAGTLWIAFLLTMASARVSPLLAPISIFVFFALARSFFRFVRKRGSSDGNHGIPRIIPIPRERH